MLKVGVRSDSGARNERNEKIIMTWEKEKKLSAPKINDYRFNITPVALIMIHMRDCLSPTLSQAVIRCSIIALVVNNNYVLTVPITIDTFS